MKKLYKKCKEKIYDVIWSCRCNPKINQHRRTKALLLYILGLLVIGGICTFLAYSGMWNNYMLEGYFESENSFTYQDVLFTQISVSFIVISLTTVLSSSAKVVYWIDKIELELVAPILTDFLAYTMYTFACLTASVYFVVKKSDFVYISFGFAILIMALLTIKLIGVYFESASLKEKISSYYDWISENGGALYEETKNTFAYVTVKYAQENNITAFFENIDFLYSKYEAKKNREDASATDELDTICLIIRLLGREQKYFQQRILEPVRMGEKYIDIKNRKEFIDALRVVKGGHTLDTTIDALMQDEEEY